MGDTDVTQARDTAPFMYLRTQHRADRGLEQGQQLPIEDVEGKLLASSL